METSDDESFEMEEFLTEKENLKASGDYHVWLLQRVVFESSQDCSNIGICNIYAACGQMVKIPFFLLDLVWPSLNGIVSLNEPKQQLEALEISLPDVNFKTLEIMKDLLTSGSSYSVNCSMEKNVQSLSDYLLWLNVERFSPDSDDSTETENEFQYAVDNIVFEHPSDVSHATVLSSSLIRTETTCSKVCTSNCHNALQSWSAEEVVMMKKMFKSVKLIETKTKLLNHLKHQKIVGLPVSSFVVKSQEFCIKFFAMITETSEYIIKTVLEDFHTGIEIYTHGNAGCLKQETPAAVGAICWLKAFSEAYGQHSPEENVTILSYWLNKTCLFHMYLDETSGPHISQSLFFEIFKSKFGHHRLDKSLPWIREVLKTSIF